MCTAGDVFQAKSDEIIGDIDGVKTYNNDKLVLIKYSSSKHIEKLSIIFSILRAAGLKFNAHKCSFLLKEIPYLVYVITWEGIEPYPNKLQGIMDLKRPITTTEARALVFVVQYYRDVCPRRSHILVPLKEVSSGPKDRKILWNDALEDPFKELNCMVSDENLLNYPDWKTPFTVHTDASDKNVDDVISQNNKPIAFFSIILSKSQRNYTTTKKEIIVIFECLNQFCGVKFGYEINVFSYHINLVYTKTLSESQKAILC